MRAFRFTEIFCHGYPATAYYNFLQSVWKCSRCGAKVKVVT